MVDISEVINEAIALALVKDRPRLVSNLRMLRIHIDQLNDEIAFLKKRLKEMENK